MAHEFDVIVIGVGAMGSAACFHLARRGVRVLGLEQFGIPHSLGSSHGDSRMIRLCYYEHPHYVPLLRRAYELWDELESLTGRKLLFKTGGIYFGSPRGEFISGTLRAAREHQLAHEQLDRSELRQRYPQFNVPDDYIGVYEPNAGFLLPERIVCAHAELSLRHGAEIHGHEPVTEWSASQNGVHVRTARGEYRGRHLIFSGGAWTAQLIQDLGVKLTVTRQVLGWLQPRNPDRFRLGEFPVWAIDHPDGTQHYGFPMLPFDGRPGLKVAHHFHGEPTTADAINRLPQPEDEADFLPAVKRFMPDAAGPILSMVVCMYTNSPDSHFIIDQPSGDRFNGRVTVACGFSGHGFKFASVVGEVLADLALGGETSHPVAFLGLDRFGS